jgi:hypothetical protein
MARANKVLVIIIQLLIRISEAPAHSIFPLENRIIAPK